ncbi:MAG: 2Fe-2S iron-sulfur cluster-binding protein [Variovorax sp.]
MTEAAAPLSVRIEPSGYTFEAAPGETLLQAGLRAGIELPTSCRNGTCRTCLCQLVSGSIRYQIDWPGVSADEKAEGWILPCVAEPISDVSLDVPFAYALI